MKIKPPPLGLLLSAPTPRTARLQGRAMRRFLLLAFALTWIGATGAQTPTPAGLWKTFDDKTKTPHGLVLIEEINGEFVGTVVKALVATEPNPVCDLCKGDLKNKPIIGMTILRGLRRDGDSFGGGTILDPDEGRTYRCIVTLRDDGNRLEVRGYIGLPWFGRTQIWVRASER